MIQQDTGHGTSSIQALSDACQQSLNLFRQK